MVRHNFENNCSVAECARKLRTDFGRREALLTPYVHYLSKKVKETGYLIDKPKRERPTTVVEGMLEAPSTSIHRRPQQLNISEISLR